MNDAPTRKAAMSALGFHELPPAEMQARAVAFLESMRTRRSVRTFRSEPVDPDVVRACIETAVQAPRGAQKQPWTFVLVRDPSVRTKMQAAGIAVGFLLAALHTAGLVALTHTPSPMTFLRHLLGRPANERAHLLIPIGLPSPGCVVPVLERKRLGEVLVEV